jgi:hypothetical protein
MKSDILPPPRGERKKVWERRELVSVLFPITKQFHKLLGQLEIRL